VSYRVGIGALLAANRGAARDPHIECDGCGITRPVAEMGVARQWFLNGKPPPKWRGTRVENADGSVSRTDYCPRCVDAGKDRDKC
jgi:hypothetical protein